MVTITEASDFSVGDRVIITTLNTSSDTGQDYVREGDSGVIKEVNDDGYFKIVSDDPTKWGFVMLHYTDFAKWSDKLTVKHLFSVCKFRQGHTPSCPLIGIGPVGYRCLKVDQSTSKTTNKEGLGLCEGKVGIVPGDLTET